MPQKSWSFQPIEQSTSPSTSGWSFIPFEKQAPEPSYWEEFKTDIGDYFKDTFPDPFKTKYPGTEGFDPDEAATTLAENSRKIFQPFTDVGSRMARDLSSQIPSEWDIDLPITPFNPIKAPISKQINAAADLVGGQFSPAGLAMPITGALKNAALKGVTKIGSGPAWRTAKSLDDINRALSGGFAVEGGEKMFDPESTWTDRGIGAVQTGLGLLGTLSGMPKYPTMPKVGQLGLPPYVPPRTNPVGGAGTPPPPPAPPSDPFANIPPAEGGRPNVVDIKDPIADYARYKAEGYVPMPGMRSPEGYPQMVHNSVAQLYRNAGPPPVTPRPAAPKPDIPGPIGEGQVRAGKTVPIPNKNVSESLRQKMKDNGYVEVSRGPTHTLFERFTKEDQGAIDLKDEPFQKMFAYLKNMLQREPTPQEVQTALERVRRPTEPSGRVADFPSRARFDFLIEKAYSDEGLTHGERAELTALRRENPNYVLPDLPSGQERISPSDQIQPLPRKPVDEEELARLAEKGLTIPLTPADKDRYRELQDKLYGDLGTDPFDEDVSNPFAPAASVSVQEVDAPPARGRGIFHPAEGGGRLVRGGPGTVSPYDRPVPLPEGQQNIPLMGRPTEIPEPLETDVQLQNDIKAVQAANRFKRAFAEPPEQLDMGDALGDTIIQDYHAGESPTPPEMVDLGSAPPTMADHAIEAAKSMAESGDIQGAREQLETVARMLGEEGLPTWAKEVLRTSLPSSGMDTLGRPTKNITPRDEPSFERNRRPTREQLQATDEGYAVLPPGYEGPFDNHVVIRTLSDGSRVIDPARTVGGTLYKPLVSPKTPQELRNELRAERLARRERGEEPSFERQSPAEIVEVFRNKLRSVSSYGETLFLLPDGTRLAHDFNEHHEGAARRLGTTLSTAMESGIIRVRPQEGVEVGAPITYEQAQFMADGAMHSDDGEFIVDVRSPSGDMKSRVFSQRSARPDAIRNWVNSHFREDNPYNRPSFEKPKSDRDVDEWMQLKEDAENLGIDPRLYDDPDELNDAILEKTEGYLEPEMAARAKMEREAATRHRNQRKEIKKKLEDMLAKTPDRPRPNDPPVIRALRAELHKLMDVAGKYGLRGLSEREMARVEQIQEKLFVYDNMQDADVPYHAKVKGGGLKITADIKRAAINLTKDYTGELSAVMLREMGQNGGDAAEKLGTDGVVKIRVNDTDVTDNGEATIEVYDNGSGLDEYGLAEKLAKLFATGKEDDPTATGGKGIGSASYLLGGKHVIIDTIAVDANDPVDEEGNVTRKADGKKYRIIASGTPEQLLSKQGSDWEVEEVDPSTPTGTTVTVTLKDDQSTNDAVDMLRHIKTHTRNKPYMLVFDEFGIMTKGTPIAEIAPVGGQYSGAVYFTKSVEDKTIGELEFKNNKINVQLPKYDETKKNDFAEIHYLNNGMYQFSGSISIPNEDTGFPPHVIVDVRPQVDEQHDDYPFINTRQDVKKDVRAFVDEFLKKHLKDPAVSKRKNRTQELYDSMTFVDIGSNRRTVIYDPGLRLTPDETAIFAKSPTVRRLLIHYDHLIESIIQSTGRQEWAARLEGIGLVLDPTMNGVHIPNPRTGKSTILINPFLRAEFKSPEDNAWLNTITNLHEVAHIGSGGGKSVNLNPLDFYLTPEDMKDPRIVQRGVDFFASYINQLMDHGDIGWSSTGHGMDFGQRLGEVYGAFGPRNTFISAERLAAIFTDSNPTGGYSPEFQRLLYIYIESRRRDETTEDLLSGTGVKQQDTESDREGNVPRARAPNGARTPSKWERVKKATGWGEGSVAADMNYGVIREAIAFFTNATTMLDFGGLTRQGLGMLLTREYPMGAVQAFRALTYGGMQKVNAGLNAKDIMHRPINEVTGELEKSFAEKEMGLPLFVPASEEGMRTEQTASKILEVGFGKDILSTIYKHSAGYPIRATNRFHITFQNYLKITRAQRLVDQLVNISRVAGETGRGRRMDMLGSLGVTRKYTQEEALELKPYHNKQRAREIGDFIRTAIGQAPYKVHVLPSKYTHVSFESAAKVLSGVMFSPGLFFSRARLLSPSTYIMASPFVRKQYLRSLLSVAAGWFLFTSIIKMYLEANDEDGEVGDDMTSADAGKVRVGNTRMDAGGGFLQFLVTYARLWYGGSTSSATGTYHRAGSGYQAQTNEGMLERFVVNKLNPFYKFAYDLGNASEYNPFHVGDRTLQMFTSLLVQDLISLHDENPDLVPGLGPAAAIGLGTQTYEHGESQGKLVAPENDWLVTGGGVRDLMPWNWNASEQEKRNFPWEE
jgi:hypothetical protein